jgi:threonine/homoserine/homoserine lactone efflux protein
VLDGLVAFVAVSAVVICTPGQDTAVTVRSTLAGGRRAGVAAAGGITAGNIVWTIAASAGVVALLSASEPVFRALKLAGAAYLVYLGAQSLVSAVRGRTSGSDAGAGRPLRPRRAFRQGLLSKLGNPKIAVFFASLLPQFVPSGQASFAAFLVFGLVFCALGLAWLSLYALAVDRLRAIVVGPVRRALDAVTGFVLVALGLRLATEKT